MMQKVFAVYDQKSEAYMRPFFMNTKGQAIRAFADELESENSQLAKHPEDYTLFEIGSYDDSRGHLEALSAPESLGTALELKSRSE